MSWGPPLAIAEPWRVAQPDKPQLRNHGWRNYQHMFERLFDDLPALNTSAEDLKTLMAEMKESEEELDLEALAEWAEKQYA